MKKCVFGLFLGLIVLFTAISPIFISQAEELENGAQENVVKSVTFLADGKPVSNGDTISLEDEFQVEYRLASPLYMNYSEEDKEDGHVYLSEGDVIELPEIMSTGFDLSGIEDFDVKLDDGSTFGTVSVSSDGKVKLTITYALNKNVNDVLVGLNFGLDTTVVGEERQYTFQLPGINPTTVTVNIDDNDPENPTPTDPVDVTTLTKDGGVFNEDGVASWEINLINNGSELTDVVLYDFFSTDKRTDYDLLTDTVVVKDENGNTLTEGVDYKLIYEKGKTGKSTGNQQYSWKFDFGIVPADKKYSVSYDTKINDFENYVLNNHNAPVNTAWAEYNYIKADGDEPQFVQGIGVKKQGTGKDIKTNAVIEKYVSSVDPTKHQIRWKVDVNKNWKEITNASITERICDGQKLVSINGLQIYDKKWKTVVADVQPVKLSDNEYRLDFGDLLNGNRANFYVITEFTEEEIPVWEQDNNKLYQNKVILNCDQHDNLAFTAYARCKWSSSILVKNGKVDKATKRIDYTVEINGGKQTLPEKMEIKDTLGKNLSFDPESVRLYIGQIDDTKRVVSTGILEEGYSVVISKDGDNEVLTIKLPEKQDNKSAYVLTYSATPTEIIADGDYSNEVQLLGYGSEEIETAKTELSFRNFYGGWAEDPTKPNKSGEEEPTPTPEPTVTPTPSPTSESSSGSSSSSNPSSGSGSNSGYSPDVVGYGETVISIGSSNLDGTTIADDNVPLAGSPVLAKTGGFIGTLRSYGAGIICLIVGLVIVFGGRKKSDDDE